MRYTLEAQIALPRDQVLSLLESPAHRVKWLRDLVSHEPIDGADGRVGTVSKVVFRSGTGTMECFETITRREPEDTTGIPGERPVHYEREISAPGMSSVARERLTPSGPSSTLWVSENEYRFSGLMRLIGPLLRRSFIAQSRQVMRDFAAFAEHGTDVREAG